MRRHAAVLALLGALVSPAVASAQTSTFTTGDEGWLVGEFFSQSGGAAPTWMATGGNPGGFIRTADRYSWNAYWAPSAYLGNKSAYYGGSMSLDMQIQSSDGVQYPMVVISNGSLRLQYMTNPPGRSWTGYLFPLTEAGWQVSNGSGNAGPAATQSQFQQVLANLTYVHVDADWLTGPDQVDLDNFSMTAAVTATPEPAAALLLLPGFVAIGAIARRRRR